MMFVDFDENDEGELTYLNVSELVALRRTTIDAGDFSYPAVLAKLRDGREVQLLDGHPRDVIRAVAPVVRASKGYQLLLADWSRTDITRAEILKDRSSVPPWWQANQGEWNYWSVPVVAWRCLRGHAEPIPPVDLDVFAVSARALLCPDGSVFQLESADDKESEPVQYFADEDEWHKALEVAHAACVERLRAEEADKLKSERQEKHGRPDDAARRDAQDQAQTHEHL